MPVQTSNVHRSGWAKAVLLLFVVVASGCVEPAPSSDRPTDEGEEPSLTQEPLVVTYAGTLTYRIGGDDEPYSMGSGDPHAFCLSMPNAATRASVHLEWTPAQQFALEIGWAGGGYQSWSLPDDMTDTGPIDAVFDDPEPGVWDVYVGPTVVNVQTSWTLSFTIEAGEDISENDVRLEGCP